MADEAAARCGPDRLPDYVLEDQVGHLLRRAHQRHTAIFSDGLGAFQLTPTQLAALAKIADEGEVSQNLLGRLTAMDPATVQGVVRRLAERGLILSRRAPDDRRRSCWRLSAAGRRLLVAALPVAGRVSDETLAPLSGAERRAFLRLLRKLG